jgi:predicted phosphodiesterase
MKIAFAGCWHASTETAMRTIPYLHEQGVTHIVHTGDFIYTNPVAQRFLHVVNRELTKRGMQLILVRGNHDDPNILNAATAATPEGLDHPFTVLKESVFFAPDGTIWEWEGVRFAALGGARSIDWSVRKPGVEWWMDEVTDVDAMERLKNESFQILVTHDVPAGVPLWFADRSDMPSWWDLEGAEAHRVPLGEVVAATRPQAVISGHMHARQEAAVHVPEHDFAYKSIILDRGDYFATTKAAAQKIMDANLLIATIENGVIR